MSDELHDKEMNERDEDVGLDAAIGALRAHGKAQPEDVKRVKRRVIESLARAPSKPRRLSTWVFPIAAVLAATTALAATGKLEVLVKAIAPSLVEAPGNGEATSRTAVPASATVTAPATVAAMPTATEESATPTPTSTPTPTQTPPTQTPTQAPTQTPTPPPTAKPTSIEKATGASASAIASAPASPPVVDAEREALGAYRTAHGLHFGSKNYAAALPAWDDYLARYPNGALAHEARYNRAICLVELGRAREAAQALEPFARGAVANGYRQSEARQLLEAMDAGK